MIRVIDANLLAALALPLPYSAESRAHMRRWQEADATIAAPTLIYHEVGNAVWQSARLGHLSPDLLPQIVDNLYALRLETYPATRIVTLRAIFWAQRLQQSRVHDAFYVALAEALDAPLWTADRRLVNGLRALGVTRVHYVGETDEALRQ